MKTVGRAKHSRRRSRRLQSCVGHRTRCPARCWALCPYRPAQWSGGAGVTPRRCLDLTPKDKTQGNLRVDEVAWTTTHHPRGATTDRAVVVGVVAGNRTTPSAYSRK